MDGALGFPLKEPDETFLRKAPAVSENLSPARVIGVPNHSTRRSVQISLFSMIANTAKHLSDIVSCQTRRQISQILCKMSNERFASWMGLTTNKDITGGKVIGRARKKVQNRIAGALRMGASTLLESKSSLGGRHRQFRRELPTYASAVKAMANYWVLLVYGLLTKGNRGWIGEQRSLRKSARRCNCRA